MANQIVEAVYEHGELRLLGPLDAEEGQRLRLTVEPLDSDQDSLELLRNIYAGLPEDEIGEIEKIIFDRSTWSRDKALE